MRTTADQATAEQEPQLELALPDESVVPETMATLPLMLSNLEVHYRDSPADDKNFIPVADKSATGSNWNDINKGFGGKYVYLKPVWTRTVGDAFEHIRVVVRSNSIEGMMDLAKGAGGDYRYVMLEGDVWTTMIFAPITAVSLWEGTISDDESIPGGFQYKTGNINEGRGKRKLCLLYNCTEVPKSAHQGQTLYFCRTVHNHGCNGRATTG